MELYKYQQSQFNEIMKELHTHRAVVAVLPCGAGKSHIQAKLVKVATDNKKQVLWIVHRKELKHQIIKIFEQWEVDMKFVTIELFQSCKGKLSKLPEPNIIIQDEAHHAVCKTCKAIFKHFGKAKIVGFTATPERLGREQLDVVFQKLIKGVTALELIAMGILVEPNYFTIPLIDSDELKTSRTGDYDINQMADVMEKKIIYGKTLENWETIAKGLKTIIYCSSIESARQTSILFKESGYSSAYLSAKTPNKERKQIMEDFRIGNILIVCNCDLLGEGIDVSDCDCVVQLRPTQSLTIFIQQTMRCMRRDPNNPNKKPKILDHVGNSKRHGLPQMDREWDITSRKKSKDCEAPVRTCPNCCTTTFLKAKECPKCGYIYEVEEAKTLFISGILEELTMEMLKAKDLKDCKTYADLLSVQKAKRRSDGKKLHPWWILNQAKSKRIYIPENVQRSDLYQNWKKYHKDK